MLCRNTKIFIVKFWKVARFCYSTEVSLWCIEMNKSSQSAKYARMPVNVLLVNRAYTMNAKIGDLIPVKR